MLESAGMGTGRSGGTRSSDGGMTDVDTSTINVALFTVRAIATVAATHASGSDASLRLRCNAARSAACVRSASARKKPLNSTKNVRWSPQLRIAAVVSRMEFSSIASVEDEHAQALRLP
jgi:hypothetical protein